MHRRRMQTAGAIVSRRIHDRRDKCIRHRRAKSGICIKNTGAARTGRHSSSPAFERRYDISAKWGSVRAITRCATRYSKYRDVCSWVYTRTPARRDLRPTRFAIRVRARIPNSSRESVAGTEKKSVAPITVKCLFANWCRIYLERYAQCRARYYRKDRAKFVRDRTRWCRTCPTFANKSHFLCKYRK